MKNEEYGQGYNCVRFHPDGLILGTGTGDALVRIWDMKQAVRLSYLFFLCGDDVFFFFFPFSCSTVSPLLSPLLVFFVVLLFRLGRSAAVLSSGCCSLDRSVRGPRVVLPICSALVVYESLLWEIFRGCFLEPWVSRKPLIA